MISIDEIIKRYNDSVVEYCAYLVAKNEYKVNEQERHLRNVGEGLSQTLELALKLHIQMKLPSQSLRRHNDTPTMIDTFYLTTDPDKCLFDFTVGTDIHPTVDFAYIKQHKNDLTNNSKHHGGRVDPEVVTEYIKQCKFFILQYLDDKAPLRDKDYYMDASFDSIQQFYVACDLFQRADRTYILLTQKLKKVDGHYFSHFSVAPWDMIIDFDKESSDNGFSAGAYHGGIDIPHIFKTSDIVSSEDDLISMRKPIYYYANGFIEEPSYNNFDDWNSHYYGKLDKFIQTFAQDVTTQKTIVVSLLDDEEFTENIRLLLGRYFLNIHFIIANDVNDVLYEYAKRKKDKIIHLRTNIEQINNCFSNYLIKTENILKDEIVYVPYLQGEGNGILTKDKLEDLEECFEILYNGIGDGNNEIPEAFLRGETQLTWQGAKRDFAAKREYFDRMYVKPIETEARKSRSKIYIIHEPGYGGTTVARQVAYLLHDTYPVLWLKVYRGNKVMDKLDWLHSHTKKTLLVFMEIPSIISKEEFERLYYTSNQSRPYVFIGIMRGKDYQNNITVTDWGKDVIHLRDKYLPIITSRYSGSSLDEKQTVVQSILNGNVEPYQRTPFFFGMLAYEKDFVAANGFFEKFAVAVLENEKQRKCLIYIAIADRYADKPLPEAFLKTVFGVNQQTIFKIENYFDEADGICNSIISIESNGNVRNIRLKYSFFSELLLEKLLRKENRPVDIGWTENLGLYCKDFIIDSATSIVADTMEREILQPIFIGSSREREGDKFTDIVEMIQSEDRINIFTSLVKQFPDNPHFCSHLARYYSLVEKNIEKALEYADRAIRLSNSPDPLLHHMKGMCLFFAIKNKIDTIIKKIKNGIAVDNIEVDEITGKLLSDAEYEFEKSREIHRQANQDDEYGYIPNIQLLLMVFDFYIQVKNETKRNVVANAKEPYMIWIDKAQSLLDNVRRMYEVGEETEHFIKCESELWQRYEDYSYLIEQLHNQLTKNNHPALVRRQLAQIYMRRDDSYKTSPKANERILNLMDANLKMDGKNISNFILWFKAARYSTSLTSDEILAFLTRWCAVYPSKDLAFYAFVFNAKKAIEGSSESVPLANKYLNDCRLMGGGNSISIKEWYGKCFQGIISNYERKEYDFEEELITMVGYVKEYPHAGKAVISLDCGLDVFFNPSINGIPRSCLNHKVQFILGFSYDGLRADNSSVQIFKKEDNEDVIP